MSVILVRQEYGGRSRPYVMRTSNSGGGHLLHYFCTIVVLLGFSVVFKTYRRPVATILCGSGDTELGASAKQGAWPVPAPGAGA